MGKRDIAVSADDIVRRAMSVIGQGSYELGAGGRDPRKDTPFDGFEKCDCSGFVAWAIGLDRFQPGVLPGQYIETSAIVRDASGTGDHRLFIGVNDRRPGDIIVYGDKDGHQGHVGIISQVVDQKAKRVVHCSHGNSITGHGAVQETAPDVFLEHGAITVRYRGIVERKTA